MAPEVVRVRSRSGPPTGTLPSKNSSSSLRLLRFAPVLKLVDMTVYAYAFALAMLALGAFIAQRSVTPPNRR
jgi:hypothetical protein